MVEFVLATHNKNKVREMERLLGQTLGGRVEFSVKTAEQVGVIDEIEENGTTFDENARIKARALASDRYISIADDSGLSVDALGGAPGVYSARWSGEGDAGNNKKLLRELEGRHGEERKARFVTAVCCILPSGRELMLHGECEGLILDAPRGDGGFGYDPLFLYEPLGRSFAELSGDEKNAVSHRGRAMRALADRLADILLSEHDGQTHGGQTHGGYDGEACGNEKKSCCRRSTDKADAHGAHDGGACCCGHRTGGAENK